MWHPLKTLNMAFLIMGLLTIGGGCSGDDLNDRVTVGNLSFSLSDAVQTLYVVGHRDRLVPWPSGDPRLFRSCGDAALAGSSSASSMV